MKSSETAYNHLADAYEERWHRYLLHTHETFLSFFDCGENDTILDLSCGTGLLGSYLNENNFRYKRLVLNDISDKMLSIARQRLREHPDIEFVNHRASNLPFVENSFTTIICLNAFHNYADQLAVTRECHRILRPGGSIYILDWNNSGLFKPINWIIKNSVSGVINSRSLKEAVTIFENNSFSTGAVKEWYWFYWKFFRFIATA